MPLVLVECDGIAENSGHFAVRMYTNRRTGREGHCQPHQVYTLQSTVKHACIPVMLISDLCPAIRSQEHAAVEKEQKRSPH